MAIQSSFTAVLVAAALGYVALLSFTALGRAPRAT